MEHDINVAKLEATSAAAPAAPASMQVKVLALLGQSKFMPDTKNKSVEGIAKHLSRSSMKLITLGSVDQIASILKVEFDAELARNAATK